MARTVPALSLGEHAVLTLLAEQPRHGWAIVRELAPSGEIGRIWSLSRPLAYRAIDSLQARRLVRAVGTEPGDGPRRTILTATASGRREVDRWLGSPVEHLRDVRTELLLKLVFGERAGRDGRPLLRAQQREFRRDLRRARSRRQSTGRRSRRPLAPRERGCGAALSRRSPRLILRASRVRRSSAV